MSRKNSGNYIFNSLCFSLLISKACFKLLICFGVPTATVPLKTPRLPPIRVKSAAKGRPNAALSTSAKLRPCGRNSRAEGQKRAIPKCRNLRSSHSNRALLRQTRVLIRYPLRRDRQLLPEGVSEPKTENILLRRLSTRFHRQRIEKPILYEQP